MPRTSQFLHEQLYRGEAFDQLREKVTTIAGCGAVGSWVALILARMGIRHFRLIDKDRVQIYNVSTQFFTPRNVGQHKVRALQEQVYRTAKARCESHPVELNERNAKGLLSNCDLVICSFDNQASRLTVKKTCLQNKTPCLFVGLSGEHLYFECVWAENYTPPDDPPHYQVDPCSYPLTTTLCVSASALTAEIAVQHLLRGVKKESRTSLEGFFSG